jgi:hypothetical protein
MHERISEKFQTMDGDGFPQYFCPDDGRAYLVGQTPVYNQWLAPYPPYFLARYDCHANAECAVTLGTFKYLFKYMHKGRDMASLEVEPNNEESNDISMDGTSQHQKQTIEYMNLRYTVEFRLSCVFRFTFLASIWWYLILTKTLPP